MFDAFAYDFMRNAVAAGLLASIACGVIGTLVVVNRMVFLAGGIAHAAYGGVGLAFFAGLPVLPCAVGFTSAAALTMSAVTRRTGERTDTVVGVLWATGMAFGILLLDFTHGYTSDLMSFLFGSILTVPASDLRLMAGLDAVLLGLTVLFHRDLLSMSYDREFAATRGVPVRFLHYLLPLMVAISVVMIIQVVGLILVMALLTIPPHIAERKTRSLGAMMALAAVLAALFCLAGLALAYRFDVSSGAAIVAVAACVFFADHALGLLPRLGRRKG